MQLAEKLVLRSYHLLDYDWTPLSRNPSWICSVDLCFQYYKARSRLWPCCVAAQCLTQEFVLHRIWKVLEAIFCLWTTHLNPGIVSAERSLCATIHWGSSWVFWIFFLLLTGTLPHGCLSHLHPRGKAVVVPKQTSTPCMPEQDAKGSQTTVLLSSVFRFLPVSFVFSYFWGWWVRIARVGEPLIMKPNLEFEQDFLSWVPFICNFLLFLDVLFVLLLFWFSLCFFWFGWFAAFSIVVFVFSCANTNLM